LSQIQNNITPNLKNFFAAHSVMIRTMKNKYIPLYYYDK